MNFDTLACFDLRMNPIANTFDLFIFTITLHITPYLRMVFMSKKLLFLTFLNKTRSQIIIGKYRIRAIPLSPFLGKVSLYMAKCIIKSHAKIS